MQRYDQLHAEETATQRVKGQGDVSDDSAMDRGPKRSTRTHSPQMLFYLVGFTLPHRAVGGVDTNLMATQGQTRRVMQSRLLNTTS